MEVNHQVNIIADLLAQGAYQFREMLDGGKAHQRLRERDDHDLHGAIAPLDHRPGTLQQRLDFRSLIDRLHLPSTEVRVHPHSVANPSSQELIDRDPERFPQDVPAGLLDARHGSGGNGPGPEERVAIHNLPEELDPRRVLTDNHGLEVLDAADDRARFPLQRGFAPSIEAGVVRLDFHKHPVAHDCVDN